MSPRNRLQQALGIVLVGTHPWTKTCFDRLPPRPLLPVAHRPLLAYALSWLRDAGVSRAAVCANRETQMLESRLHRHVPLGLSVSYHEDTMPLGTAGAIRDAALRSDADYLIVTDGTSIPTPDLASLLAAHQLSGAAATVVMHVESRGCDGSSLHVPTGTYVFSRQVLDCIPERGFCDIKETLIPALRRAKLRVNAYEAMRSPRVLDAASYRAVNEWILEQIVLEGAVPAGYCRSGSALIHRDASVAPDAMLVGPVLIGPGARIEARAVVVGPTSIGRDAIIGEGAAVSRSAVWRRCAIGAGAIADSCVLADDTVVPASAHLFGAVLSPAPARKRYYEPVRQSSEQPSFELLRRLTRMVFGGADLSRYPATQ